MKNRNVFSIIALSLILVLVLAGCSSPAPATGTPAATPTKAAEHEKVTLNVLSQRVEDKAYYDAIVTAFQTKYPWVTVKVDLIPTAQYHATATARIASDSVDVLVSPDQTGDPDTRTTLFLNLKGQTFLQNVYKENLDDTFMAGVDQPGDVYVVPIVGTTFVTFYNKKIFSDQSISVPTTYSELIAACEKLKTAGITPFLFGGKDQWPCAMIFDSFGPPLVQAASPDFFKTLSTGETKFTDAVFVEVLSRMNALYKYFDTNSLGIAYADASISRYDILNILVVHPSVTGINVVVT